MTTARLWRRTFGVDRVAAISDGVFAVMLTLLVLDLKVPEVAADDQAALTEALAAQFPNFLAWLVSFVLIARFWVVHHDVLSALRACQLGTMATNFALLGLISLVPFGSGLVGTYEFDLAAVLVFTVVLGLCGAVTGWLAWHVARVPHLHAPDVRSDLSWHWRYHAFGIPLFALIAGGWAVVHEPGVALAVWLLEPLVALLLTLRRGRTPATATSGSMT